MAKKEAGQPDLRVEWVPTGELAPYAGNAKEHPEWQVGEIVESIKRFGFSDPIGAWHDPESGHAVVVEGHGRLMAAKELGMETVPAVWLDHLDDEGRRAYGLVHNQLTMDTGWDLDALEAELDGIDIDMGDFGLGDGPYDDAECPAAGGDQPRPTLAERFGAPPFSVLDARSGAWIERKRAWVALGIRSELGRGAAAGGGPLPLNRRWGAGSRTR